MQRLRLYADTSVFGGCHDEEFARDSRRLMEEIKGGRFTLLLSATTAQELTLAPDTVRATVQDVPEAYLETIHPSEEISRLRDAYVEAEVVGPRSRLDAEHIAAATVAKAELIVSWNFKHIVHFEKIRGYHAVNHIRGYPAIPIHTPTEVIEL